MQEIKKKLKLDKNRKLANVGNQKKKIGNYKK